MKVVCAGLNKTGTKSLAEALRVLGYNVYDYEEQTIDYLDHWIKVFNGDTPEATIKLVYHNADAVVDYPGLYFWEEILDAFPGTKVILSVRDEDKWIQSWMKQLAMVEAARPRLVLFLSLTGRKMLKVYPAFLRACYGEAHNLKNTYVYCKNARAHNDRVRAIVPKENLLEYSIKQGWKPLCDFLGQEIPNVAFPHENVKGEIAHKVFTETRFAKTLKHEIVTALKVIVPLIVAGIAILVYLFLTQL